MTVAAEVRKGWVSKPRSVEREHFKLEFRRESDVKSVNSNLTPEQKLNLTKSTWFARVGLNPDGTPIDNHRS